MTELIFLVEERSAKAMLETLLPRILNSQTVFRCIDFEGKQDLEKQLTRKIKHYQNSQAKFIVLRDQDSHPDCKAVKNKLMELCEQSGKLDQCLVRIACTELETFYLADLFAVEKALGIQGLQNRQKTKMFRSPDSLGSPSRELKKLTKNRYEKVAGSRAIGVYLDLDNQRSPSFFHLINAIRRMDEALHSHSE